MGLENPLHIILILVVVLLVFGAKRLPEMGRSLGDGMRGFKEAIGGQSPVPTGITTHDLHAHEEAAATAPVVVSQPAVVAEPVGAGVASHE
jgi:sec-independent protein translocase protein TatA